MPLRLDTSVQFLKGVGPRRAEAFRRLGVGTVEDLLYHVPHRYLDATSVTPIAKAAVGTETTLVGRVVSKGVLPTRRRLRVFRAVLRDESGLIECAWPGQAFLDRAIREGQLLLVSGPIKYFHGRQMNPREQIVLGEASDDSIPMDRGLVVPVYSATEGLSHRIIRRVVNDHLEAMVELVSESTPADLLRDTGALSLPDALRAVHAPRTLEEAEQGRRRLALDELFELQLVVTRARDLAKHSIKGVPLKLERALTTALKGSLPFSLTGDQRRAIREIVADMTSSDRMHRLVMGDVGSGKTVVALFAMLLAVENECQAVFMAPTELLAEQHARTIASLLAPLRITPEVLLGRMTAAEKTASRRRMAEGAARVIVGTHALFQESTTFKRLGLVVIDEQHRFGVEQRAALIEKGAAPDVLLLTATPIPRTLALTLYGDLDVSEIREKPAGRAPVKTMVRSTRDRSKVHDFLRERCAAGEQAYVVYPVIEESEKVDLRAATTMADKLREELAPVTVGLVHGRMKAEERDQVMRDFHAGRVAVLVATAVIEVGIDVANATVMVVEHPERFGLAQLHQLRGRVGRGERPSFCVLLCDEHVGRERLKQFAATTDGFAIADLDLKERGMGQLVGTRQSGGLQLRYTDLAVDGDLVRLARTHASRIIDQDPLLSEPTHQALLERIERRYERGLELFRVG
jgi:ATP-dependent DNA helicase RecG